MRIGVVTTSFPEREGALAGSFVLELSRALVARGHLLEVVAPDPGVGAPPRWSGIEVRWARYHVRRRAQRLAYGAGIPDNLRRRPMLVGQAPLLVAALAGEIARRRSGWDAIVSHWLVPSGLAAGALRNGRPHVAIAHSADVWLLKRMPLGQGLLRLLAARSTALAAVSPRLVDDLVALDGGRASVTPWLLPLGPDELPPPEPAQVDRLRRQLLGLSREGVLVATVLARLVPVKGVHVLLEALACPEARGVVAVVAGDGPERARLEARVRELGVPVHFMGAVEPERRSALLAASDVLVVPSIELANGRGEGAPVAAIEGLAAGLPVIASRVGGLSWSVGAAGILVEPGSPGELARALARLRDDASLRDVLSRGARCRARHFGWAAAAERLESLITRAGSGQSRDEPLLDGIRLS